MSNPEAVVLLPKVPRAGSVEHFYHFMMSYFLTLDAYIAVKKPESIVVRDCGPMNAWFDLLDPNTSFEIRPRTDFVADKTGDVPGAVHVMSLEIKSWAHASTIRAARKRVLGRHGVTPTRPSDRTLTLINRMPSLPFYREESENRTSGAERRSIPNYAELCQALTDVMPLRDFEGEHLTPREQIRRVNATSILVGQHGAGLTNMVWMTPGSRVVEILPDTMVSEVARGHFRDLAHACGHSYKMVRQVGNHTPADVEAVLRAVER